MKKAIAGAALGLGALLALCACAGEGPAGAVLTEVGEARLHTAQQAQYLAGNYDDIKQYADGKEEKSRPEAVHLSWSGVSGAQEYLVALAAGEDFGEAEVFSSKETSLDVINLRIATDYSWRVTAVLEGGERVVSGTSSFHTEDVAPRNLEIDGITNVRDLGGWETPEGRVRQGALIRCGRLNKSETTNVQIEITERGIEEMKDRLGVRTEIDLRTPTAHNHETGGIAESPLGEGVTYRNIPFEYSVSNYLTGNLEAVKEFFEVVSDESNYPVIFHCNIGTDRTGMLAYLINGLLGVSEEDLYRDYTFSNFGKINGSRSVSGIEKNYVATVKGYPGDTLREKIENCLLDIGVPQAQLDALKANLIEL